MNKYIFALFLFIFLNFSSFAQNSGLKSTVLMKGRVINFKTLAPIETKFFIVSEDGKKIQVKSANDGSFSIPISTSGTYSIQSENWICVDPVNIEISVGQSYSEKEVTIYFIPYESGLILKKVYGFSEFNKGLTDEGKNALSYICKLNKTTPKLYFSIILRVNESFFKDQSTTVKEGKKKKKIVISARQQAERFAQELILEIKEFLATQKLPERKYAINVEYYSESIKTTKTKKGNISNSSQRKDNLEIKIETVLKTDLPNSK